MRSATNLLGTRRDVGRPCSCWGKVTWTGDQRQQYKKSFGRETVYKHSSKLAGRPAAAGLGLWLADRLGEMNDRAGVVQTFRDLHEIHSFAVSQKFTRGHRYNSKTHLRTSAETFGD